MKLKLTPRQFRALHDGLLAAFNVGEMTTMLDRSRRVSFEDIAEPAVRRERFAALIRATEQDGWLPEFVEYARQERPSDFEAIAAEVEIMERGAPLVTAMHEELIELLRQREITEAMILAAYRFSAPEDWGYELRRFPLQDAAAAAVYKLADTRRSRNHYPLLEFAELIRKKLVDEKLPAAPLASERIDAWMQRMYDQTQTEQAMRDAIRQGRPRTPARQQPLYLLITVAPVKESKLPAYTLSASRQLMNANGTTDDVSLAGSEAPRSREDLPGVISRFIAQLDPEREEAGNLTVEIFLPHHLLDLCVDQWPTDQEVPRPIGSDCHVVLRSWERSYEPHYSRRVRRPWLSLWTRHSDPKQRRALVWKAAPFDAARYPTMLDKPGKESSCVILNVVPCDVDYARNGMLETVIGAGTPVAVWPRLSVHTAKLKYRKLLRELENDPSGWRERITSARVEGANADERHFGRHLCLLWDDPQRVPPREGLGDA